MSDQNKSTPTILVAGAGGHLGSRVVEILIGAKYPNLVAGTRNPDKLERFLKQGVELRKVDFDDPSSLNTAFKNVERLLLISTNELHAPGARIRQHRNAIEAAKSAGVKHIVYTSMPHPKQAKHIPFAPDHVETEKALENSGLNFTSLRISWYAENLLGFLPQIIAAGKWPTVAGDGRIPYISREDVAQASAGALLSDSGKNYTDISGAEALSISQIADIASEIFQKPIEVIPISDDDIFEELVAIGISPAFAPTVIMTDLNTRAGNFNIVSAAVEKATGHAPLSLKEFFKKSKSLFIN